MDYVTRQFINLTKKFRKESRKALELFHRDIEKHTEAINAQHKRQEQQSQIQPIWLEPILSKYEETEGKKTTDGERHYRIQNSIRWATWSAFIAASIYGAIAGFPWWDFNRSIGLSQIIAKQSRIQSAASKQSADTAYRAMVLSNRPWLGIDSPPRILEPAKMSNENGDNRIDLKISIVPKNFGNSPALHVQIRMSNFDDRISDMAEWLRRQKIEVENSCKFAEQGLRPPYDTAIAQGKQVPVYGMEFGDYVLPGKPYPITEDMGLPRLSKRDGKLYLIGCIAYDDQFKVVRHSTFCFRSDDFVWQAGPQTTFIECGLNQYAD